MEGEMKPVQREEYAIVLDFLLHGYPFDSTPSHKKQPIIQAIGVNKFSLLELVAKRDMFVQPYEKVYLGEGKRDKVHHILGRLAYEKLTPTAKAELPAVIAELVKENEKRFIEFFNTAKPLTTRMHSLELLPGLGKKHMWEILEKREEKPFESFADIKTRIHLMPEPEKIIVKRILQEIMGLEKHNIFVE